MWSRSLAVGAFILVCAGFAIAAIPSCGTGGGGAAATCDAASGVPDANECISYLCNRTTLVRIPTCDGIPCDGGAFTGTCSSGICTPASATDQDATTNDPGTTGTACTPSDAGMAPIDANVADTGAADGADPCDPTGTFGSHCYPHVPTPACGYAPCLSPTTASTLSRCDNGTAICLDDGSGSGLCFGECDFALDGSYTKSCAGNGVCEPTGFVSHDAACGWTGGVGSCAPYYPCSVDADCKDTTMAKCQREFGICVSTLQTFSLIPVGGAPSTAPIKCTRETSGNNSDCPCLGNPGQDGVCYQLCFTGVAATCSLFPGTVCTAFLPKTTETGAAAWTAEPSGLAGSCLKPCDIDADCNAEANGPKTFVCDTSVLGAAGKKGFCVPGTPCKADTDCTQGTITGLCCDALLGICSTSACTSP